MPSLLMSFRSFWRRSAIAIDVITGVVRHTRRPGIGLALVVLLSMVFAVVAQAQTDSGGNNSSNTNQAVEATPTPRQILPLPIPYNVRVIGSNYDTIVVSWDIDDSGYAQYLRYQLELSTNRNLTDWPIKVGSGSTSASKSGLPCDTLYYVRVRSHGDGSIFPSRWSSPSSITSGRTILCPPPAPTGFSAWPTYENGTHRIEASWNALRGALRYSFGIQIGPHWHSHTVFTGTSTEHSSGLTADTTYNVRVQACGDGATYSTDCGEFAERTVTTEGDDLPTPDAPSDVVTDNPTETSIQVRWRSVTGASKYKVQRSNDGGSTWGHDAETTRTQIDMRGLTCGTGYYFRVLAYGNGTTHQAVYGNPSGREFGSTTSCVLPTPAAPSDVATDNPTDTSIQVSWSEVNGASTYYVQRSDDGGYSVAHGYPGIDAPRTEYRARGLECDRSYHFRVVAYGNGTTHQADFGPLSRWVSGSTSGCTVDDPPPAPTVTATPEPGPPPPAPSVSSISATHDSITVNWHSRTGVVIYELGILIDGAWQDRPTGRTSGTKEDLEANTLYQLRLRGHGDGGSDSYFGWGPYYEFSVRTQRGPSTLQPPPAPSNVRASVDLANARVTVTWDAVDGVDPNNPYKLERGHGDIGVQPTTVEWPDPHQL